MQQEHQESDLTAVCIERAAEASLSELQARGWEITLAPMTEADAEGAAVRGTLCNRTGRQCGYLQIEFELLNAEGMLLGRAIDLTQSLAAGGVWQFCARAVREKAGRAAGRRFVGLTAVP